MRRIALALAATWLLAIAALMAPRPLSAQLWASSRENGSDERVHVVREGETLWSLAKHYYGDPFLWPVIYEANRSKVRNPHRIFVKQRLVIPPKPGSDRDRDRDREPERPVARAEPRPEPARPRSSRRCRNWPCAPVLLAQPGVFATNLFSPPQDGAGGTLPAAAQMQLRAMLGIPTPSERLTLGLIVQGLPFNNGENMAFDVHQLAFGYTGILHVIPSNATGDRFSFDLAPMGVFSPTQKDPVTGEGGEYSHKFVIEANSYFHIGRALSRGAPGLLRNTSLHALVSYGAKGFPEFSDPWGLQVGLTFPLTPMNR